MKKSLLVILFMIPTVSVLAQTPTDGLMMPKGDFCTGFLFTHDKWTDYWEGNLKRHNDNIGSVTTNSLMYMGNYGISKKLNVIAMVPYVWTKPSGGTLTGMEGIQDLSVYVKYNFYRKMIGENLFDAFVVGSLSAPLTDYSPDFLPMSIGMGSKTASVRLSGYYKFGGQWFVNASGGYMMRSNVFLDRPSYYTDGQLFMTNEVALPNVFDYFLSAGYKKGPLQAEVNFAQQGMLHGGDIRRQDMPFVSNKMNFSKAGVLVMYYLPKSRNFAVRGAASYTVAGRNVGQSTTLMAGLLYTFHFSKQETN